MATSQRKVKPPGKKSRLRRLLPSREWKAGEWIAFLALMVAAVTFVPTYLGYKETKQGNEKSPDLSVAAVSVGYTQKIDATEYYEDIRGRSKSQRLRVPGPRVDITLKNGGTASALMTAAEVTFQKVQPLEDCGEQGGPVLIEAEYDIASPWTDIPKLPYLVTREMRYEVRPDEHERLALTIGRPKLGEGNPPWLFLVEINFRYDGGRVLNAATVTMVDTGWASWILPRGDKWVIELGYTNEYERPCMKRNAQLVRDFINSSKLRSRELVALDRSLEEFR